MISINVTNPTIQRILLDHVIETIETQDGMDALIQVGCSEEFIDAIRHRQARDLINVVRSLKTMQFSISTTEVIHQLRHLDRRRRDAQLQEYFVMHGASRTMLNNYFKMSADEVRRMRELLLPGGVAPSGRTALPPEKVRDEIHKAWGALNARHPDEPMRERMYRLHQQFPTWSIDTLNETAHEFDERPGARPAMRAAATMRSQGAVHGSSSRDPKAEPAPT